MSELADIMERRRVDVVCFQEIKWKGAKAVNMGRGYKLFYFGSTATANGVGIAVASSLQDKVIKVERVSDRLMGIKLARDSGTILNIICAYAPQTGQDELTKQKFWEDLENFLQRIPQSENRILARDLNGHVGRTAEEYKECHGGFGFGSTNSQCEDILQLAQAYGFTIVNTFFQKSSDDFYLIYLIFMCF